VFLTALAIADDIGAILVIAIFYTTGVSMGWLAVVAVLFLVLLGFNRLGYDSPWPYAIVGVALWAALFASGVHATIAGVLVALTIPATAKLDPFEFSRRTRSAVDRIEATAVPDEHTLADTERAIECLSIRRDALHTMAPLQRMESALHPWTTFLVLPLFALGNAGVRLIGTDIRALLISPVSLGIILGLVIGKPLGIVVFTWLAVRLRLAELPSGVAWIHVLGAGILGGIGFTVSLFVTNLAFRDAAHSAPAKAAILLASGVAGFLGYVLLRYASSLSSKSR
jgi:NhaA family Na+:H+ antiporter